MICVVVFPVNIYLMSFFSWHCMTNFVFYVYFKDCNLHDDFYLKQQCYVMWHGDYHVYNMRCLSLSKRLIQKEVKVGMLLTLEKHTHEHIISQRAEVGSHKTSITSPPGQVCKRSCICALAVSFHLFLLDFETLPTVCFPTLFSMSFLILPLFRNRING